MQAAATTFLTRRQRPAARPTCFVCANSAPVIDPLGTVEFRGKEIRVCPNCRGRYAYVVEQAASTGKRFRWVRKSEIPMPPVFGDRDQISGVQKYRNFRQIFMVLLLLREREEKRQKEVNWMVATRKDPDMKLDENALALFEKALAKLVGEEDMKTARELADKEMYGQKVMEAITPLTNSFGPLTEQFGSLTEQVGVQNQTALFMNESGQQFGKALMDLNKPFGELNSKAEPLPGTFGRINTAASNLAINLGNVSDRLGSWQPPTPTLGGSLFGPPKRPAIPFGNLPGIKAPPFAVGGDVTHSGLAIIHAGEKIVPAKARKYEESSASVTINAPITVIVKGEGREAQQEFRRALDDHAKHIERLVTRQMQNGRQRA